MRLWLLAGPARAAGVSDSFASGFAACHADTPPRLSPPCPSLVV